MSKVFQATRIIALLSAVLLAGSVGTQLRGEESDRPEAGSEIRFRVTGLRSDEGQVVCSLFPEDDWLGQPSASVVTEIEGGSALCVLASPQKGVWGLSAIHDENADGRLETGFMRIPKEGTCASNNAFRRMGPPRFKDARFDYEGGVLELESEMRYLSKK